MGQDDPAMMRGGKGERAGPEAGWRRQLLTTPNLLCLFRLAAAPFLLVLAAFDQTVAMVVLFVVLLLADWIDGRIARRTRQQTLLGSRLDSIADAVVYGAAVLGALWLQPTLWRHEWPWLVAALASYVTAVTAALIKFHHLPSYHTRSTKVTWGLASVGLALVLLDVAIWPFRIAMAAVVLTNLEGVAITLLLRRARSDVPSFWHALRMRSPPEASS